MKTALVTGAGRGIGRTVAEFLLGDGYKTVVVSRTESELHALTQAGEALPFVCDLTDSGQRTRLRQFCEDHGIAPHVLVNNAGAYFPDDVLTPDSQLRHNLDINLIQVRELTALLWDGIRSVDGYVFNIVSVLGKSIRPEAASYTMAKSALSAYNRLLFHEGRKVDVKVTGIFPASVYTPSWEGSGVDPEKLIAPSDIALIIKACLSLSAAAVPEEIHLQCMTEGF